MDFNVIFRLSMSILGTIVSFYLGYYVLSRGEKNWIKISFALYCVSGGLFILTRALRIVLTVEQYEIYGATLVYLCGMCGVPVGIALFSRLLTHGEEDTFNTKILSVIVVPPVVCAFIGLVFNPSEVITIEIGHVQVFEPWFQVLYVPILFGWMIYAAGNVGIMMRDLTDDYLRKKMGGIRNGLTGIVVTGFIAYGVATNMGWYNIMFAGDLLVVMFQAYIAYTYLEESV
jgi:hypothetical protein